ncbi:unnamed protein product, partial [Phaeothamnion confervicola]
VAEIAEWVEKYGAGVWRHGRRIDEEQERELEQELEEEKEVQRPSPAAPHPLALAAAVAAMADGFFDRRSPVFKPVAAALDGITLAPLIEPGRWSPEIFVTTEFVTVLDAGNRQTPLDDFVRPPRRLMSVLRDGTRVIVLVSTFKANELVPLI